MADISASKESKQALAHFVVTLFVNFLSLTDDVATVAMAENGRKWPKINSKTETSGSNNVSNI
jgi:hypothetical protein